MKSTPAKTSKGCSSGTRPHLYRIQQRVYTTLKSTQHPIRVTSGLRSPLRFLWQLGRQSIHCLSRNWSIIAWCSKISNRIGQGDSHNRRLKYYKCLASTGKASLFRTSISLPLKRSILLDTTTKKDGSSITRKWIGAEGSLGSIDTHLTA